MNIRMIYRIAIHLLGLTIFFELLNVGYPTDFFSSGKLLMVCTLGVISIIGIKENRDTGTIRLHLSRTRTSIYIIFSLFLLYTLTRVENVGGYGTLISYTGYFILVILITELPQYKRDFLVLIGYFSSAALILSSGILFESIIYNTRPFPFGMSPNVIARVVIFAIVFISIYYIITGLKSKIIAGAIAIVFAISVVVSGSRAGLLFLAVFSTSFIGLQILVRRENVYRDSALVLGGLGFLFTPIILFEPLWTGRFITLIEFILSGFDPSQIDSTGSIATRIALFQLGQDMFLENPLIGSGLESFRYETATSPAFDNSLAAHSTINQVGAQLGLIGLGLVGVSLLLIIRYTARNLHASDGVDRVVLLVLCAGFASSLFLSLTYDILRVTGFWVLTGLILGFPRFTTLKSSR